MAEKNTADVGFEKQIWDAAPEPDRFAGREKEPEGKRDPAACALGKGLASSFLGKTVHIVIDRPMGSVHPEHRELLYPVNYGFVPKVPGGDGEEMDVYLLGVDTPQKEYTGKVIGIVHRENDLEDKLVVAPEGVRLTQNEIARQVQFQEQYYKTQIEALYQKSCGAVVFRRENGVIRILCLFQRRSQTYSVPKGHMEGFETEEQTARREIREETGLSVEFVPGFRETIGYSLPGGKQKTVVLFLAECTGPLRIDGGEIGRYGWLSMQNAKSTLPDWYGPVLEKAEASI